MADATERWRRLRPLIVFVVFLLAMKLIYFAAISDREPPAISDDPEGLRIVFSADQSALLVLEQCVSGRWEVEGVADDIRVNGKDWNAPAAGEYRLCNREDPTPTLEVRLPSTAIAHYRLDVPVIFGDGLNVALGIALIFSALYFIGATNWSHRSLLVLVAGAHAGMVLYLNLGTNLSIEHSHHWGNSLHTLPLADLKHNLWETFLHLHNQPPLFTVYGLTLDFLFGESLAMGMYLTQVICGILMCLMTYVMLWHYTKNKNVALFISLLLALNPSYFLYEALGLYTMLSAFFVMTAAFCLTMYMTKQRNRYLYCFVLSVNLLILVRSVYHVALLIPLLLLVYILCQRDARRVLIGSLLICLLSVGWFGKNLLVHQSFSSSSWLGMSLWKVARYDYDADELVDLYKQDVLTDRMVIWWPTFEVPSVYPGFTPIDNGVPILSGDNSNNAVYPRLTQHYLQNALSLIRHDPWRYIRGALRAYGYYSCPSSTWEALFKNSAALPASYRAASHRLIHMRGAAEELARVLGMSWEDYGLCSNLYFIIPLLAVALPLAVLAACRISWTCWRARIRREAPLIFIWGIVAYTSLAGNLFETPENARYKFMIEIPLFVLLTIIIWRIAMTLRGPWRALRSIN
ncbi:MAG: glycosyltransferase family 39 protein [Chloroflexi bacterium]|nr:glycosyltransferase family 39 protein [Chloroflexota bacterium]